VRERLDFLTESGSKQPVADLLALFELYKRVDRFDEYIKPGERAWFPENSKLRTEGRFLVIFETIYHILTSINERIKLQNYWEPFWTRCIEYLKKVNYEPDFICALGEFERYSFNWWRREMRDDPEALDVMYQWFRCCFGIVGLDDYCRLRVRPDELLWDWRRMAKCYAET
jgi:hypothetical protein